MFLTLLAMTNLPVLFGNISLGKFQTVIGKTNQIMKQGLVSLAIGLPLAWFMVGYFSSIGELHLPSSAVFLSLFLQLSPRLLGDFIGVGNITE